MMVKQLTFC